MIPIYDVLTAQKTILHRTPPGELLLPPSVTERIAVLFGEPLTPAEAVHRILSDIRQRGDQALRYWSLQIDGLQTDTFHVPSTEIEASVNHIPDKLRRALELSIERVTAFHQKQPHTSWIDQDISGTTGQLLRPLERIGIYVPGGTAPLPSTIIMSAVPARVAGVKEIVIVTPPNRETGKIPTVTLAAARLTGIDEVYTLGGAQAIGALAYGTESIRPVEKIVGPGNLFVTLAKQQVFGIVGIDGLAGPTETVVIADDSARPDWIAADLLAQAEHDVLASAILLTSSRPLAEAVQAAVAHQLETLERQDILQVSLSHRGGIVVTKDIPQAIALANVYAPEHLELVVADPWRWVEQIRACGGIFIGEHSYEVLGDYIAGPSHVMPTGGSARFASPLNVWDFLRIISVVALNPQASQELGNHAAQIAQAEGLTAHAHAATIRNAGGNK